MPELVSLSDFKAHLGDTNPDETDAFLTDLLDDTEELLEEKTNRSFHGSSSTGVTEVHDGNGRDWVYVDRPVDTLTEIKIGFDPADPDETLDEIPDDIQSVGNRKVMRRDGGVFPEGEGNLHVTYDAGAYTPGIARRAVLTAAAYFYRRRGREHVSGESVGEFGSVQMAALFGKVPEWNEAVESLRIRKVA